MKKLLSVILLATAVLNLVFSAPAFAADAANGAKIFSMTCAACHAGGRNVVMPPKSLQKADLEKYGMYSEEAIIAQVTNGKGAMPSFKGKYNSAEIADVASYVLAQADKGWK